MKKFSRCALILILVAAISGAAGFIYFNQTTTPMYSSTTKLYIVPGADNEASVRAKNGGLNNDFMIIFKSNVVISAAQTKAGTSEDIAQYLTITSPDNSNVIEITCTNPDQNTAKKYADAVAVTAIKTTSIIPVESIQILSEGTTDGVAVKPNVKENALKVVGVATAATLFIEIIVVLLIGAFKNKEDDYDDELEYEKKYGRLSEAKKLKENEAVKKEIEAYGYTTTEEEKPVRQKKTKINPLEVDALSDLDSLDDDDLDDEDLDGDDFDGDDLDDERLENSLAEQVSKIALEEEKTVIPFNKEAAVTEEPKKEKRKKKSSAKVFGRIHK